MTEQAVHMEIPTETCTHDIKKNANLQHYFFRFMVFSGCFGSYANLGLFVLLLLFFLCKRDCFDGKSEI